MVIKCDYCKKSTENKRFCSKRCYLNYAKKRKIGCFFNKELQSKGGKRAAITNKKNKSGFCHNNKLQEKGRISQKRNKTGRCYDKKLQSKGGKIGGKIGGKMAAITNKRNGTSVYSPQIQKMGGKVAGLENGKKVVRILRIKKRIKWKNIYFDSYKECEIGMCIHYQFNEDLKEKVNYQVLIGNGLIDFFIKRCFIEYHPVLSFFHKEETDESYYEKRRNLLDNNGYENYNLIIIK